MSTKLLNYNGSIESARQSIDKITSLLTKPTLSQKQEKSLSDLTTWDELKTILENQLRDELEVTPKAEDKTRNSEVYSQNQVKWQGSIEERIKQLNVLIEWCKEQKEKLEPLVLKQGIPAAILGYSAQVLCRLDNNIIPSAQELLKATQKALEEGQEAWENPAEPPAPPIIISTPPKNQTYELPNSFNISESFIDTISAIRKLVEGEDEQDFWESPRIESSEKEKDQDTQQGRTDTNGPSPTPAVNSTQIAETQPTQTTTPVGTPPPAPKTPAGGPPPPPPPGPVSGWKPTKLVNQGKVNPSETTSPTQQNNTEANKKTPTTPAQNNMMDEMQIKLAARKEKENNETTTQTAPSLQPTADTTAEDQKNNLTRLEHKAKGYANNWYGNIQANDAGHIQTVLGKNKVVSNASLNSDDNFSNDCVVAYTAVLAALSLSQKGEITNNPQERTNFVTRIVEDAVIKEDSQVSDLAKNKDDAHYKALIAGSAEICRLALTDNKFHKLPKNPPAAPEKKEAKVFLPRVENKAIDGKATDAINGELAAKIAARRNKVDSPAAEKNANNTTPARTLPSTPSTTNTTYTLQMPKPAVVLVKKTSTPQVATKPLEAPTPNPKLEPLASATPSNISNPPPPPPPPPVNKVTLPTVKQLTPLAVTPKLAERVENPVIHTSPVEAPTPLPEPKPEPTPSVDKKPLVNMEVGAIGCAVLSSGGSIVLASVICLNPGLLMSVSQIAINPIGVAFIGIGGVTLFSLLCVGAPIAVKAGYERFTAKTPTEEAIHPAAFGAGLAPSVGIWMLNSGAIAVACIQPELCATSIVAMQSALNPIGLAAVSGASIVGIALLMSAIGYGAGNAMSKAA